MAVGKRSVGSRYSTPESEALGLDIERAISELTPDQTRELGWYKARQRALDGIERQGPDDLFDTERAQMLSALREQVEAGPPSATSPTLHHTPPAPELGPEPVRGYRVQGGVGNSSSQGRLIVQSDGTLSIDGTTMLYINFGQEGRALEFKALREAEGSATIVEFEVDPAFVQRLRDEAVPQRGARQVSPDLPRPPQQADRRTVPDSFGIPCEMFADFLAAIIPGSVRVRG